MLKAIQAKHAFLVTNLLLTTAISFYAVELFYKVVTTQFIYIPSVRAVAPPVDTGLGISSATNDYHPYSYYNVINERNLFNTKPQIEETEEPDTKDTGMMATTELNVKLWGTVIGTVPEKSFAVIQETKGTREQALYHIGDPIQGATIEDIMDEKVILKVNGELEVLEIESLVASNGRGRGSYTGGSSYSSRSSSTPVQQQISLDKKQLDDTLANVNDLMKEVRITPHPDGFRVSRLKSSSPLRQMGLRNGDVLMGVDGQPIKNITDGLRYYEKLVQGSPVSVQIKRRGRERNLEYSIR